MDGVDHKFIMMHEGRVKQTGLVDKMRRDSSGEKRKGAQENTEMR